MIDLKEVYDDFHKNIINKEIKCGGKPMDIYFFFKVMGYPKHKIIIYRVKTFFRNLFVNKKQQREQFLKIINRK